MPQLVLWPLPAHRLTGSQRIRVPMHTRIWGAMWTRLLFSPFGVEQRLCPLFLLLSLDLMPYSYMDMFRENLQECIKTPLFSFNVVVYFSDMKWNPYITLKCNGWHEFCLLWIWVFVFLDVKYFHLKKKKEVGGEILPHGLPEKHNLGHKHDLWPFSHLPSHLTWF